MATFVTLGRALFIVIGGGALVMAVTGLAGGAAITDPVFPAGLALGVLAVAAGAWTTAAAGWQAILVWLGVLAVVAGVAVFGRLVFFDPDIGADVYPYFLVPALVVLAAAAGVTLGRVRAGALGG